LATRPTASTSADRPRDDADCFHDLSQRERRSFRLQGCPPSFTSAFKAQTRRAAPPARWCARQRNGTEIIGQDACRCDSEIRGRASPCIPGRQPDVRIAGSRIPAGRLEEGKP
jgi:hypothetical protein